MNDYLKDYLDVLTPQNIMKILGISKPTMYRLLRNKKIQSIRIGALYRIPKCYLENYLFNSNQISV